MPIDETDTGILKSTVFKTQTIFPNTIKLIVSLQIIMKTSILSVQTFRESSGAMGI